VLASVVRLARALRAPAPAPRVCSRSRTSARRALSAGLRSLRSLRPALNAEGPTRGDCDQPRRDLPKVRNGLAPVGSIWVRQRSEDSGALLNAATRCLILIDAQQKSDGADHNTDQPDQEIQTKMPGLSWRRQGQRWILGSRGSFRGNLHQLEWHWRRLPRPCARKCAIASRFFGPSGKRESVVRAVNERERCRGSGV